MASKSKQYPLGLGADWIPWLVAIGLALVIGALGYWLEEPRDQREWKDYRLPEPPRPSPAFKFTKV